MLLAEDLLLLLTDDDSGKAVVDSTRLDLVLAGAVVLELAELGRVGVTGPGESVKAGRLVVRDASPTGVPVLDEALDTLTRKKPDKAKNLLSAVAKGLRTDLLAGLTDRGILRAEQGKVLGIFPTRSWPAQDATHEQAVRRALHDVLVVGRTPTPRESVLVSLLQSVKQVPKALTGLTYDRRAVDRRVKDVVGTGDFASQAVRKAVDEAMAAIFAATTAATST